MNLFKRLFNPKKQEIKNISYDEIPAWIEEEKKELEEKEKKELEKIKLKIDFFIKNVKEKSEIAKKVDLTQKKAEERLKSLNEDGKKKYFEFFENFIEKIEKINENSLSQTEEKIDQLFLNFKKNSEKNYEKATILIGKEMAAIKKEIKNASEEFIQIFEKNRKLILSEGRLNSIENKIKKRIESKDKEKELIKDSILINNQLKEKEKENKENLLKIEEFKKSKEYEDNIKNKKEIELTKEKIKRKIFELKQEINFKELSNLYHSIPRQMSLIKEYQNNFIEKFSQEEGRTKLIKILKESKMFSEKVELKLEEIQKLNKSISLMKKEFKENKIPRMEFKSKEIVSKIEDLKKEKSTKEKLIEKIKEEKKELIEKIDKNLSEFSMKLREEKIPNNL